MNRNITEEVKKLLIEYPETRDSDLKLYIRIAEKRGCERYPLCEVLSDLDFYDMPPFETVRRSRQKVQEFNPDLKASAAVQEARRIAQEAYLEFGRRRNDGTI